MKHKATSCFAVAALLLLGIFQAAAQGTKGSGLIIRLTIDGVVTDYYAGNCGYGTATWGGGFTGDICRPVAWTQDITPDSLACDSVPAGSLAGKAALIRRGICGFSIKALNAQKAGAEIILVANNTANDCTVQEMGATQPQAGQVTVPVLLIAPLIATRIDDALKAGKTPTVCLLRADADIIDVFYPASSMQTPESQIATDTFGFGATLTNPGNTDRENIIVTVRVENSQGDDLFVATDTVSSLTAGAVDTAIVDFQKQLFVPDLPIDRYTITYTSEADPASGVPVDDRNVNEFYVTQNLFAKDDGATIGFRPNTFNSDNWAVGNVYHMSPASQENYEVSTVEFAFSTTPAELPLASVETSFYIFRINDDVLPDWSNFDQSQLLSSSMTLLGIGSYEAPSNVTAFSLQQVEVSTLDDPDKSVPLEAGAQYMVVAQYADSSLLVFNSFNEDVAAPGISTVVFNGTWFLGGFTGNPNAVLRMYLDLVTTTDEKPLPESVISIVPNPVYETLNLKVAFGQPTDATITIAEVSGRVIFAEDRPGLTEDLLTYQVPQLSAGTYLARIATKEGTRTKKFVVQK